VPGDGLSHALFAQSPLSTVVYDGAGHVVAANAAFERLFGLRVSDLPRSYTILADPQLAAQGVLPEVRRAFAGEAVVLPPVRYESAPDLGVTTSTWTQAYLYPLRDAGGVVTAVVLLHLDLTARVEAEEALRASESRLRLALEGGHMGAWEWELRAGRMHWSETLERIHGLAPGAFDGSFAAYQRDIHPHDRDLVSAAVQRTLAGDPHELDYRIVRPDGEVRWLSARGQLVRDAQGAPERIIGICADVTDMRRSEEGTRLLAAAGAALAASLDYERTLATVARLTLPALADYCIIDVVAPAAPGGMRRVAAAHADPARGPIVDQLLRFAPRLEVDGIVARTVRSSVPQLVSPVTAEDLEASAAGRAEHAALLRELAPEALLCVPLAVRETVIGTMLLASAGSGRRYGPDDLPVALELARRAAVAVSNAQLHEEAVAAREASEQQAVELELQTARVQEQATELEAQQHELQEQIAEAEMLTVELRETNDALGRARDAAEAAARDVQAILTSISDPFVVHDPEWRFRYINEPARVAFQASGRAAGERGLLGSNVWEAYPEILGTTFERAMRRAAEERVPVTFEEFYPQTGLWSEVPLLSRCPTAGSRRRGATSPPGARRRRRPTTSARRPRSSPPRSTTRRRWPRWRASWCRASPTGARSTCSRRRRHRADGRRARGPREGAVGGGDPPALPSAADAPTGLPNVIRHRAAGAGVGDHRRAARGQHRGPRVSGADPGRRAALGDDRPARGARPHARRADA
jgi:PAS domain S-box-containing protein